MDILNNCGTCEGDTATTEGEEKVEGATEEVAATEGATEEVAAE